MTLVKPETGQNNRQDLIRPEQSRRDMRVIRLVCVLVAIMWPAARSRCTLGGNPTFKEAPRVEQVSKHWCWPALSVTVTLINRLTDKVKNGKVSKFRESHVISREGFSI